MGLVTDSIYLHLDAKTQLLAMFSYGFNDIMENEVDRYKNYKISVLSRDPIITSVGEQLTGIPCISINRDSDKVTKTFIGNTAAIDEETGNPIKGRMYDESYEVKIWSTKAYIRDLMYIDIKRIFEILWERYLFNNVKDVNGNFLYGDGHAYQVNWENGYDYADHKMFKGHPMYFATAHILVGNSMMVLDTANITGKFGNAAGQIPLVTQAEFDPDNFI